MEATPEFPRSYTIPPPPLPFAPVVYLAPVRLWRLVSDYTFTLPGDRERVTVPGGYEFDLASIPKRLWDRIGPHELSVEAPLLHDWLYDHLGREVPGLGRAVPREEADNLFHAVMERQQVPDHYRFMAWRAVRRFGGLTMRVYDRLERLRLNDTGVRTPPAAMAIGALAVTMGPKGQLVSLVIQLVLAIIKRRMARRDARGQASPAPPLNPAPAPANMVVTGQISDLGFVGGWFKGWFKKKPAPAPPAAKPAKPASRPASAPAARPAPKPVVSGVSGVLATFIQEWKKRERFDLATGSDAAAVMRWDPYGRKWESGYGITDDGVADARRHGVDVEWMSIDPEYGVPEFRNKADADEWFARVTVPTYLRIVRKHVKVRLSERQEHALASFAHNCGEKALMIATGGPGRLNDGNFGSVREVLPLYVKGGGKTLPGLVKRRKAEVELFYS